MKSFAAKLACILSLLISSYAFANDGQADVGAWSIGINAGLGQRSAFITGQDDLDIYLLPDIHYYGEQFFFDNGTLGYTLSEQQDFAFSLIGELNPYGLYFEQSAFGESFNSLYLLNSRSIAGESSEANSEQPNGLVTTDPNSLVFGTSEEPSIGDHFSGDVYNLPKPDLSIDLGVQGNWFFSDNQSITVKLVKDVSSKHSGFRAKFNWSMHQRIAQVKLNLSLGFDWLSEDASNYYFGISPQSPEFAGRGYKTGSSTNPFVAITGSYPISKKLSLVAHLKYLKLDADIADSPITSESYTLTHFAGIHYKFW